MLSNGSLRQRKAIAAETMQPLSRGDRVRDWPKSLGNQSVSVSRPPQTHPPPLFSLFLSPIGLYPAVGWGFGTSRITGVYPPSLLPGLWCELIIFFLLLLSNLLHWTHSSLQPGYFIPLLFSSPAAFHWKSIADLLLVQGDTPVLIILTRGAFPKSIVS